MSVVYIPSLPSECAATSVFAPGSAYDDCEPLSWIAVTEMVYLLLA